MFSRVTWRSARMLSYKVPSVQNIPTIKQITDYLGRHVAAMPSAKHIVHDPQRAHAPSESLDFAVIPLGSQPEIRLHYINKCNVTRFGKLLEDLDTFADAKVLRKCREQTSVFRTAPTEIERTIIHDLFLKSTDPETMRGRLPTDHIMAADSVVFRKSVEIGSLLLLSSQVCYSTDRFMQLSVRAHVMDVESGKHETTNTFQFTFKSDKEVPTVMPKSYADAMLYLNARRHFDSSAHH